MFSLISKKINWSLAGFFLTFIVIELIVSVFSIGKIIYRNFETYAKNSITLNIDNCDFLLSLATHATDISAQDENLLDRVKTYDYSLNSLKLSSLSIMGVTLYDLNGNRYYSEGMVGVVSLTELQSNQKISEFMENEEQVMFSLRNDAISTSYGQTSVYDPRQGVISYICKLYDQNEQLSGYLFVDISPRYLYSNFFDYKNEKDLAGTVSFIVFENQYFQTNANANYENYLLEADYNNIIVSKDRKYVIITKPFSSFDAGMVTLIPIHSFYQKAFLILYPVIAVSILFIALSVLLGKQMSAKIVGSLTALNQKMKEAEKYIVKG